MLKREWTNRSKYSQPSTASFDTVTPSTPSTSRRHHRQYWQYEATRTHRPTTLSRQHRNCRQNQHDYIDQQHIESTDTIDLEKWFLLTTISHFTFTYLPTFRAKILVGEVLPISIGAFVAPSCRISRCISASFIKHPWVTALQCSRIGYLSRYLTYLKNKMLGS